MPFLFPLIGKNLDNNSNFSRNWTIQLNNKAYASLELPKGIATLWFTKAGALQEPFFLAANVSFARTQRLSTFLIRCAARKIILRACGATASAASSMIPTLDRSKRRKKGRRTTSLNASERPPSNAS